MKVSVQNSGSGCDRSAHLNAAGLRNLGFDVTAIGELGSYDPDTNLDATTIEYPHSLAAEAAVLAAAVPLARRVETGRVGVVTLLIGANQAGVPGLTPTHPDNFIPCSYLSTNPAAASILASDAP